MLLLLIEHLSQENKRLNECLNYLLDKINQLILVKRKKNIEDIEENIHVDIGAEGVITKGYFITWAQLIIEWNFVNQTYNDA